MTEEHKDPIGQPIIEPTAGEPTEAAAPEPESRSGAAEAWRDVVNELDALGDAIARWAKSAVSDPENKRRLDELSARFDGLVSDVNATVKGAAESEIGESFKEAAEATGEAFRTVGERISEEVGPVIAGAFKSVSEKLRGAAERIEDKAGPGEAEEAAAAPDTDTATEPDAESGADAPH